MKTNKKRQSRNCFQSPGFRYFFNPDTWCRDEKNHRKLELGTVPLIFRSSLMIVGIFLINFQVFASPVKDTNDKYSDLEREIVNQLNQERVNDDLKPLKFNSKLKKAATFKLNDMIGHNYFSHIAFDGRKSWHWFEQSGYKYKFAGENLAINFHKALEVHEAWMKSKTHRENILFPDYKNVAVVVGKNKEGKLIAVELFGTKMGAKKDVMAIGDIAEQVNKKNETVKQDKQNEIFAPLSTNLISGKFNQVVQPFNFKFKYNFAINDLVLLLVGMMCFILIVNIWVLEKEDENILAQLANNNS